MSLTPAHDPFVAIEAAGAATAQDAMRRILVVDDESTIRLALSRFLRTRGFEVEAADSGIAAMELLSRERFSLMLCDLRMPGMTGLEVVPRALSIDHDLGIIMLTAVNDASSATEALTSGAFDYLTKPVELPDLQAAVERIEAAYQSTPGEEYKGCFDLQVQCLFGTFLLRRAYYYHPGKKCGHYPADTGLGLEIHYTPALARLMTLEGADGIYDKA
jgi:CheY-like chemotaxis protein